MYKHYHFRLFFCLLSICVGDALRAQEACLPADGSGVLFYGENSHPHCNVTINGDFIVNDVGLCPSCMPICATLRPQAPRTDTFENQQQALQYKSAPLDIRVFAAGIYNYTFETESTCVGSLCCDNCLVTMGAVPVMWTVHPIFDFNINGGNIMTICSGEVATMSINCLSGDPCPAAQFTWSHGLPQGLSHAVTPTVTTTYTVTGDASITGCSATRTFTISVLPSPSIAIAPSANPVCENTSFTINSNCGTCVSYDWSPSGQTTPVATLVLPAGTHTHSLRGYNSVGCQTTVPITITATAAPSLSIVPPTPSICLGGNVTLTASGASTYTWSQGGNTAAINVTPPNNITYTVTGSNGSCSSTATVSVSVTGTVAPAFSNPSPSFCAGGNVTLSLTQAYSGYTWSQGSNTSTINVNTAGTYAVTVADAGGCTGSVSVAVTTVAGASVNITVTDNSICNGESTTLTAVGTAPFSWNTGATTSSINVSPVSTTTYTVVAGSGGCTATAASTITVNATPSVSINTSPAAPQCAGVSRTLTASGASTYSWSTSANTASINVNPVSTLTYTVTGLSAEGCSDTEVVTVTTNPNPTPTLANSPITLCTGQTGSATLTQGYATYLWLDPDSGTQNTAAMSINSSTNSGLFRVTVTDANGCTGVSSNGSFTRAAGLTPAFTTASLGSLCAGSSRTLSLTSAFSGYNWSTGATTATINITNGGTYAVTVNNAGCEGSVSLSIASAALPSVVVNAGSGAIYTGFSGGFYNFDVCASLPYSIVAAPSGGATPYTYAWSTGATNATLSATAPGSQVMQTRTINITDNNGCTATSEASLTVDFCTTPAIVASAATICAGSNVVLSVSNLPSTNPRVFWSTGDSLTSTIVRNPTVTTTYSVQVYTGSTFVGSDTVVVTVVPATLSVAAGVSTLCSGGTTSLTSSLGTATCPSCVVDYFNGMGTLLGSRTGLPDTAGVTVPTGVYYARMTQCNTLSNVVFIGQSNINANVIAIPDTTLCGSGDSSTLVASGSCTNCSFVWFRNGTNLGYSSTTNIINVNTSGSYVVSITDLSNGCFSTDTMGISGVANRIISFNLSSPLTLASPTQNLTSFVVVTGTYPSTSSFAGSGVTTANFSPSLAGIGSHFITYSYTEGGCTFSIMDTIQIISNASAATFLNTNAVGADSIYSNSEACVGDTLVVTVSNYNFSPAQIEFSNGMGGFLAPLAVQGSNVSVDGSGKFNGTFFVVVPAAGKTGTMRLRNGATTANLGAIVINNPDLAFIGVVNPSCSGTNYPLTGLPAGGVFSASYTPTYAPVAALVSAGSFMATSVTGYVSGSRSVLVRYTYTPRYGNGAGGACPDIFRDTITTVLDVNLDTIIFDPISISESNVPIDSILNQILPSSATSYPRTFSGSFVTLNAGNYFFQPNLAGVGNQPITMTINNGACSNSRTGIVPVLLAPNLVGLVPQYCDIAGIDTILRDPNFLYTNTSSPTLVTYSNEMSVSATNYSGTFTAQCSAVPASQCYLFNPGQATAGNVVLTVLYRRTVETYSGATLLSRRTYIVGRSVDTIVIGSGSTVDILTPDTLYCAGSGFRQIQLTPSSGTFTIRQLGGTAPNTIDYSANISGGLAIVDMDALYAGESTNVYYRMIYTFGAAGCSNSDSLTFVIPQPANANFVTQLNTTGSYCRLDIADTLNALVLPQNRANTSLFTINNIPAIDRVFNPNDNSKVFVGQNIITHSIANNFGCVSIVRDTFIVHPMPSISFTAPAPRYCVYDNAVTIQGFSTPATGSGTMRMSGNIVPSQIVGNPYSLSPSILGASTVADTLRFIYRHTDGNGCTDSATVSTIINPRPLVDLAPLQPVYCLDPALTVELTPTPAGGTLSSQIITGTVSNVNTSTRRYIPNNTTREIVIYNYTSPTTNCSNTYRDTVAVDPASAATLGINIPSNIYCFTGDTIQLYGTRIPAGVGTNPTFYTNATTANGGIVRMNGDTAWFVPNQAQTGQVVITYGISTGSCSKITQTTVTINPLPVLSVAYTPASASFLPVQRQLFGDTLICDYSRSTVYVFDANRALPIPLQPTEFTYTGIGYYTQGGTVNFITDSIAPAIRHNSHAIAVSHTNANGCTATVIDSIRVLPNMIPSVVGLSSAYCLGGYPDTIFGLPVNGTWSHTFTPVFPNPNPTFTMFPAPNVVSAYAVVYPHAVGTAAVTYRVNSANNCFNERTETITINPGLAIQINAQTSICSNSAPINIRATNANTGQDITDIVNFSFSRAGTQLPAAILNDTMLDPSIGASNGNLDTLIAMYSDAASGCADTATQVVLILPAPEAVITFPNAAGVGQNVYCIDNTTGSSVTIQGSNAAGALSSGAFSSSRNRLLASTNTTANMLTDSVLVDTIQYIAIVNSCADTTTRTVEIRGLPTGLAITGLNPIYCQNTDNINITGFPTPAPSLGITGVLSLRNVQTGSVLTSTNSNTLNLSNLSTTLGSVGQYQVSYQFTNEFGCINTVQGDFTLHPNPVANFTQTGSCAGETLVLTDASFFNTTYDSLDQINQWIWLYNSQTAPDTSVVFFPSQIPNTYPAQLTVVSDAGCSANLLRLVSIYRYPVASFEAVGGCQGVQIDFIADSTQLIPPGDSITFAAWDFGTGIIDSLNTIVGNFSQVSPSSFTYTQSGVFTPRLTITNRGYCTKTDSVRLIVSPTVALQLVTPNPPFADIVTNTPYLGTFEQSTDGWLLAQDPTQSDWHWGWVGTVAGTERLNTLVPGNPNQRVISTAKGVDGADAVTPFGDFVGNTPSWVYSPCYDFTHSQRPMIKFDYASDMRTIVDGATMEYYDASINPATNRPTGWRRFGDDTHGINWYNSTNLISLFTLPNLREYNILHGWSDTTTDWQTARYRLDQFRGQRDVRLRIAFAAAVPNNTGGVTGRPFGGFAFDNVWVGERGRNVLVEHFASVNYPNMQSINQHIYNLIYNDLNYQDVALIQYHTGNTGTDPYHSASANNGAAARILRYGISNMGDGRTVVDGNYWLGLSQQLTEQTLDHQMLQDPFFSIRGNTEPVITLNVATQSARLQAIVRAERDMPFGDYTVYPTIVEDSLQAIIGLQRSVFRTFLPNATAIRSARAWVAGEELNIDETWQYNISDLNLNHLKAVIFVQDSASTVYHAVSTLNFDVRVVGVEQEENFQQAANAFSLQVFPNPASELVNLRFDEPLQKDFQVRLYDLQGRLLQQAELPQGTQIYQLPLQDLPTSTYIIQIFDNDNTVRVQRKLIIK